MLPASARTYVSRLPMDPEQPEVGATSTRRLRSLGGLNYCFAPRAGVRLGLTKVSVWPAGSRALGLQAEPESRLGLYNEASAHN